jgi:aspartate-semialdehyde dehydrogenase
MPACTIACLVIRTTAVHMHPARVQEMKMTKETRKIWGAPDVMAMATCIRVPVMRAHAESINLEFQDDITEDEARALLAAAPRVSLIDDRCASKSGCLLTLELELSATAVAVDKCMLAGTPAMV